MQCNRTIVFQLAILVGLLSGGAVRGSQQLRIETSTSPELLPYSFRVVQSHDWGVQKIPVDNQVQVLHAQHGPQDTALYIHAFNGNLDRDNPAVFSLNNYAIAQAMDWDPVRLTLTDFTICRTSSGVVRIVGGGYRNDSAFVVSGTPGGDFESLYLTSGRDRSGNGKWEASVAMVTAEDYDYDGRVELFAWVGPGRDLEPRVLYCLEIDSLSIEWSLPVAGAVSRGNLFGCGDSADPAVVLTTYNFKNGVADDNFSDHFCQLAKIDRQGEVVYNRIISEEHGSKGIWPGERAGLFYVFHALPMAPVGDSTVLPNQSYQFSKVDSDLQVLVSIDLADQIRSCWWDEFEGGDFRCLYTLSSSGIVRVFDSTLQLLAESNETELVGFEGTIRLAGQERPVYLFRSGDGRDVFSHRFKHLGHIDVTPHHMQPLVLDEEGNTTLLMASRGNKYWVIGVRVRSVTDYLRILFWENQGYVLAALTLLALALVIMNSLRARSARRLTKSESHLRAVLENSQDIFYRSDLDGRIVWASPHSAAFLGYESTAALIGSKVTDFYADPEKRRLLLEKLQQDGVVTDYEVELRRHDGGVVVVSTNSNFYRDEHGEIVGVEGMVRDITERKRAERALAESEERYRSLVESAREAIFSLDREGRFLFMNSVAASRLGGVPRDYIGKTMWDLFPKPIADQQMGQVRRVFDSGEGLMSESITELQGQPVRYVTTIQPIKNESGAIVAAMAVARDISELTQARQELESERHFVRSLLDTANSLIVCLDTEARITVFNKECEQVTGFTRDEVMGRSWPDLFLPAEAQHEGLRNFTEWVRMHPRDTYEGPLRTKPGEIRTILWSNSTLFYPDSDEFTAIAVGQDVTEKRRAQDALRESELRYASLAESAMDGIMAVDIHSRKFLYANMAMCRMLGYSREEFMQLSFTDCHPRQYVKTAAEAFEQIVTGRKKMIAEMPMLRKDGTIVYVDISGFRQRLDGREAVIGFFRDVTDRKRAEEALRDSEEKLRSLVENAPDIIVTVDRGARILFLNRTISGRDPQQLIGTSLFEHISPDQRERVRDALHKVFENGETVRYTVTAALPDGSTRWFESRVGPILNQGRVVAATVISTDVTDRVRAEEAVQRSQAQLRAQYKGIPVPTYTWQQTGDDFTLIDFNDAALEITRGGIAGYIGKTLREMYGDNQQVLDDFRRCFRQKSRVVREMEYHFRTTDRDAVLNVAYVYVPPDMVMVHTDDITERKRAETALVESEEFNRAIVEKSPVGVSVRDRTGRLLAYNQAWREIWQVTDEDLHDYTTRERSVLKFDHRDIYLGKWIPKVRKVYEEGGYLHIPEIEVSSLRKGRLIWLSQHFYAIKDARGVVDRVVILTDDITERKLAEAALVESEEFNRAVIEKSPIGVSVRDRTGRLVAHNAAWREIWGIGEGDLREQSTRQRPELRFDERDEYLGSWQPEVRRVYEKGGYLHIPEVEVNSPYNGKHLWVSQHFYAIKNARGEVERVVILTDDITAGKQAEAALRESEERFRTIAEATPFPLAVSRADNGEIMYANAAFAKAVALRAKKLKGLKTYDFYAKSDDREAVLEQLRRTGSVNNYELMGRRVDGSTFWALLSLRAITFYGVPAVFGGFNDITEHKEAQRRLQAAEQERHSQTKQLAGGVAHEIYNALFPATSSLAKLGQRLEFSSPEDVERNRQLLTLAESAVGRAIEMTDLVTKYSRLDSEVQAEAVALRPLLTEVLEAHSDRISTLGIEVSLRVPVEHVVEIRPNHLHSLLSNLLVNSMDALEESAERRIAVTSVRHNDNIRIEFADSGPGIAPQHRARVFDPFYSTKPTRGTGLGLAIVKRIAEMYGGRVELERPVDKGAVFVILLKSVPPSPTQGERQHG